MRKPSQRARRTPPLVVLARVRPPGRLSAHPEVERLESRALLTTAPAPIAISLVGQPIRVLWDGPASPDDGDSAGTVQGTGADQTATAGMPTKFSGLASFSVPGSVLDSGPFQANTTWGDGLPIVTQAQPEGFGPGGPEIDVVGPIYGVSGADADTLYTLKFDDSHSFASPGTYTFTTTLYYGDDATPLATATGTVTVGPNGDQGDGGGGDEGNGGGDDGTVQGTARDLTATAGVSTGYITVADFTIPSSLWIGHGIAATVDWGDGTAPTQGAPDLDPADETFDAIHTYTAPGVYTYTVTYVSDGVSLDTVTGTVTVTASGSGGDGGGGGPIQFEPIVESEPGGPATATGQGIPAGPTAFIPVATPATAAPSSPTPANPPTGSAVASVSTTPAVPASAPDIDMDVLLEGLWAGLYTTPGMITPLGMTTASTPASAHQRLLATDFSYLS